MNLHKLLDVLILPLLLVDAVVTLLHLEDGSLKVTVLGCVVLVREFENLTKKQLRWMDQKRVA